MITSFIYSWIYWIFVLAVVFIIVFCVMVYFKRMKNKQQLNDFQSEMLSEGKQVVKENLLRNLYLSDDESKQVNAGKIKSCVEIENDKKKYLVFGVANGIFNKYDFYKVLKNDVMLNNKGELFGDVTIRRWNFKRDTRTMFMVYNEDELIESEIIQDENRIGVDTVARISPIISNAILINAIHRIKMREQKLIKLPSEQQGGFPIQ